MRFRPLFALLLLAMPVSGCISSSPPTNFYVLIAPPERAVSAVPHSSVARQGPRLGILPIGLPGYLDRSQMVIRHDNSVDVKVEDYDRWGENLSVGITRVLSIVLTNAMADIQGVAMPARVGIPMDLRLQVDVRRFEGSPDGQVTLEALWALQKDRVPLREGHFVSQTTSGPGKSSLVRAQSYLVEELGAEIAAGVRALQ